LPLGTGAGAINKGFGNEGLYLAAGKTYEGFLIAKSAKPVNITLSLTKHALLTGQSTLAQTVVTLPGGAEFVQLNFSLTPSAGAECHGISDEEAKSAAFNVSCPLTNTYVPGARMSDRSAHVCVWCEGQFHVWSSGGAAETNIGFVSLMPGEWGRFKSLPVRLDAAETLLFMGITMVRWGGSFEQARYGVYLQVCCDRSYADPWLAFSQ
jgi:hypothetical protein